MEAANGGYVEVGQLLLDSYADPNTAPVPSSRDTALTIAADKGHDRFVELLLQCHASVDIKNKKGCSALWLACHGGHIETVQVLVKHKVSERVCERKRVLSSFPVFPHRRWNSLQANVEAEDNRKVTPLMIAFRKGHTKVRD